MAVGNHLHNIYQKISASKKKRIVLIDVKEKLL